MELGESRSTEQPFADPASDAKPTKRRATSQRRTPSRVLRHHQFLHLLERAGLTTPIHITESGLQSVRRWNQHLLVHRYHELWKDHVATSRLCIQCPGCDDAVTLRIAIGFEDDQHFYFVCPSCHSAIRACLRTNQSEGELLGLELDGAPATILNDNEAPVVNISTEYPMDPHATSEQSIAGSGFMMHGGLLGDAFHRWRQVSTDFDQSSLNAWPDLRRWWGFYTRQDWQRFDEVAQGALEDHWPTHPSMLDRHHVIHQFIELLFLPLHADGSYVRWKKAIFQTGHIVGPESARSFATTWGTPTTLRTARERLFDVLDQFVEQRAQWRPGQLVDEYRQMEIPFDPSWRLMRDDFRTLRDLHNTAFERSHQYLPALMGLHNAHVRDDSALFPDGSTASTKKLSGMTAKCRGDSLIPLEPWGLEIEQALNRKLRNTIGHADAMHDLAAGKITSPKGSVTYPEFVSIVARTAQLPLLLLTAIKYVSILRDLAELSED